MWAFIFGFPFGVGSFNAKSYLMYLCYVKLCANLFYGLLDRIRTIRVRYDLHLKNKIFTPLPNSSNSVSPFSKWKPDQTCPPSKNHPLFFFPTTSVKKDHLKVWLTSCSSLMKSLIRNFWKISYKKKKTIVLFTDVTDTTS